MAEQENVQVQAEKKSSNKGIIIALFVLIIILIISFAGGGYYIVQSVKNSGSNQMMGTDAGANVQATNIDPNAKTFSVEINDLILNITTSSGREKLMKLSFSIKSTESSISSLVEDNKPEIIDLVISLISARNAEELLTIGGKELLKEELILELNGVLNRSNNGKYEMNSIRNLFFTSFVIK